MIHIMVSMVLSPVADPGFSFEGGTKDCVRTHIHKRKAPCLLWQGSRANLRALEALGFVYAVSCYLCLISIKHSDSKWALKT